jgi:hypothetical protein
MQLATASSTIAALQQQVTQLQTSHAALQAENVRLLGALEAGQQRSIARAASGAVSETLPTDETAAPGSLQAAPPAAPANRTELPVSLFLFFSFSVLPLYLSLNRLRQPLLPQRAVRFRSTARLCPVSPDSNLRRSL